MRVKELDLQRRYGLTLLEIRSERKRAFGKVIDQHMAWADSVISHGDILFFYGDQAGMQRLAADYRLQNLRSSHLDFYDIGISEIVILPTSRLIGTRIKDSRLREDYALNILGIRRDEERITEDLGAHRLHNGDILLVQGKWDAIIQMNQENENWVALGRPARCRHHHVADGAHNGLRFYPHCTRYGSANRLALCDSDGLFPQCRCGL